MTRRQLPRLLLVSAAVVFVAALVVTAMLLLWPNFPLWEARDFDTRIGLAGILVGLFGVASFMLSLAAGVIEVELIFPRQRLGFEVEGVERDGRDHIWELV